MESDSGASDRYAFFDGDPDGYDRSDWLTGLPLNRVADTPMAIRSKKVAPISDAVLSSLDLPIFSPKLRDLLTAVGATNIQYVPVRLIGAARGTIADDYCAANVLGLVDCIIEKKAFIERSASSGRIMSLEEFALDPQRIVPLAGMDAPPAIFRLRDYRILIIADEKVKTACQEQKISGIKFIRTTDY